MSRAFVEIASRQNPIVRECRELARSGADAANRVLLDGAHLVEDALAEDVPIETAVASHAFAASHARLLDALARRAQVYLAKDDVLEAASPVKHPSGIVAIASLPLADVPRALAGDHDTNSMFIPAMSVALVDVQDPGNAGAVVRAVEAAGGTGVIGCGASASLRGWRALRASMGSAFRVPIAEASLDDLIDQADAGEVRVIASTLDPASSDMRDITWTEPFVLLVGNEGRGLTRTAIDRAQVRVRIPMFGRVQSMNAAVSAAVILYEAQRQRSTRPDDEDTGPRSRRRPGRGRRASD